MAKVLVQIIKTPLAKSHFICAGFQNIATAELCARWIAVGAWQPFTRDHHAQSFQELYRCDISQACTTMTSSPHDSSYQDLKIGLQVCSNFVHH